MYCFLKNNNFIYNLHITWNLGYKVRNGIRINSTFIFVLLSKFFLNFLIIPEIINYFLVLAGAIGYFSIDMLIHVTKKKINKKKFVKYQKSLNSYDFVLIPIKIFSILTILLVLLILL